VVLKTCNSRKVLAGAIIGLLSFSIFGHCGGYFWFFDLFSHFSLQYFSLGLCFLILILIFDRKNYLLWFLLAPSLTLNSLSLYPFYVSDKDARSVASQAFQLVTINLNSSNDQIYMLKDYLKSKDPDVVVLMEITPSIGSQLSELKVQFPYGKAVMEDGNFGMGIISKLPLSNTRIHRQNNSEIPFISTEIQLAGHTIGIVAAHPFPPLGSVGTQLRNEYTNMISQFVQANKIPTILCGDFNASPWSHQIKKLIAKTALLIPKGKGLVTTWPSSLPFLRFRLIIASPQK
jgi:endonuclease/exonuclease/phosphatase (EEP) superfamily protein YafD